MPLALVAEACLAGPPRSVQVLRCIRGRVALIVRPHTDNVSCLVIGYSLSCTITGCELQASSEASTVLCNRVPVTRPGTPIASTKQEVDSPCDGKVHTTMVGAQCMCPPWCC
jgi:hypothetical protein